MESILLSRTGAAALTAATALAEVWTEDESHAALRAQEIAQRKSLPAPFVAKLLVQLSARGLVTGARGRGGGYKLARPPSEISLFDVVAPLERWSETSMCPFRRSLCSAGAGDHCPLHEAIYALRDQALAILKQTALGSFRKAEGPTMPMRKGTGKRR